MHYLRQQLAEAKNGIKMWAKETCEPSSVWKRQNFWNSVEGTGQGQSLLKSNDQVAKYNSCCDRKKENLSEKAPG